MKYTFIYTFVGCTFVALLCAMVTFGYWKLIDVDVPVESKSVELLNEFGRPNVLFRRGELMVIDRENCAREPVTVNISRALIRADGFVYVLPSGPYVMEAGCRHTINGVVIPPHVIPGKYEYWVTMQYQNNPLNSGQLLLKVPELTVVP